MFGRRQSSDRPSQKKETQKKTAVEKETSAPETSVAGARASSSSSKGATSTAEKKKTPSEKVDILSKAQRQSAPAPPEAKAVSKAQHDLRLNKVRGQIMDDLRDAIDIAALAKMENDVARQEMVTAIEAILLYRDVNLTPQEARDVIQLVCDEVLGLGPLEPLLARDDIADIMVNGANLIYIEANGQIEEAPYKFRDNAHLLQVCQRIVAAVGRRVDESSPICDARLPDGSRVNVIINPLSVDGPSLTIRKFKKEKLTFDSLIKFGSMSPACAKLLAIAATCRVNVVISGGTGSGKTTMLNCLTSFIEAGERTVTCEDACELQLQQRHVVRLETRPANTEGVGEITMRELVKNCLRMRPDRIIVGEVRGSEAFDLLQAMNTGHDGSMGTIHANTPRECISRLENMIAMGGFGIPVRAMREQISSAVGLIIQIKRLRDGSRRVTHVTEVLGMEGDVVTLQDLCVYDIEGEDENGKLIGRHRMTGVRPGFYETAKYYGLEAELLEALEGDVEDD